MASLCSSPHVVVVSHQRSGTHLTIDTIRHNFAAYDRAYVNLDRLRQDHNCPLTVAQCKRALAKGPCILKTHMHADPVAFFQHDEAVVPFILHLLEQAKIVYVCRDGRDVLTSLYYYMQSYVRELAGVPFSAFLRQRNDYQPETYEGDLSRAAFWAFHVRGWLENERYEILPVAFETLRYTPEASIGHLSAYLDQPVSAPITPVVRTPVVATNRILLLRILDKLVKLHTRYFRHAEYSSTFFRKGVSGDYKNHFDEDDLAYFDAQVGDALRAVQKLGEHLRVAA